ncbi:glycosyltransferase family 2 protein [uncultured Polaribacter sp.]|uniref:glycosyltransferase family 2 protein n=1 Tax=uncultured Polaribacter sp. TaxID=174711 RepID=UPI00260C5EC3|nr:glycosyltransferase family 2 protein [uncultured Polaribacter sp.]
MKEVYIIIVTYNAMTWIKECLDSCKGYKVIVVDNNSNDKTVSYISVNYPEVIILKQKNNLGFGRANNIGINYAINTGCDYVFLLNQDAYLVGNVIDRLVNVHLNNLDYGILSPIHINKKENLLDEKFSNYLNSPKNKNFYSDYVLNNDLKDVYKVPFVNAASWLIPIKVLLEVGGFDTMFFLYGEDDNLCQRMEFHKYKVGVVSKAKVIHDREFRNKTIIKKYSKGYFKQQLISYKVSFGNINNNGLLKIKSKKTFIYKQVLKNVFFLKFKTVLGEFNNLRLLRLAELEIRKSYQKNKLKGPHYLKLK